jgi:hypothetical protein
LVVIVARGLMLGRKLPQTGDREGREQREEQGDALLDYPGRHPRPVGNHHEEEAIGVELDDSLQRRRP